MVSPSERLLLPQKPAPELGTEVTPVVWGKLGAAEEGLSPSTSPAGGPEHPASDRLQARVSALFRRTPPAPSCAAPAHSGFLHAPAHVPTKKPTSYVQWGHFNARLPTEWPHQLHSPKVQTSPDTEVTRTLSQQLTGLLGTPCWKGQFSLMMEAK